MNSLSLAFMKTRLALFLFKLRKVHCPTDFWAGKLLNFCLNMFNRNRCLSLLFRLLFLNVGLNWLCLFRICLFLYPLFSRLLNRFLGCFCDNHCNRLFCRFFNHCFSRCFNRYFCRFLCRFFYRLFNRYLYRLFNRLLNRDLCRFFDRLFNLYIYRFFYYRNLINYWFNLRNNDWFSFNFRFLGSRRVLLMERFIEVNFSNYLGLWGFHDGGFDKNLSDMRIIITVIVFIHLCLFSNILHLNCNFLGLLFDKLLLTKLFLNESIDIRRNLSDWFKVYVNFFGFKEISQGPQPNVEFLENYVNSYIFAFCHMSALCFLIVLLKF
ncbi:hypothetical protein DSECCO2_652120 [anaerobic digester metagenome]